MVKKDFSKKIEEFRNKNNQEKRLFLSSFWEFNIQNEPFKLIGSYEKADKPDKNGKEYGFFINVRNLNGDILYYPFNLGQVRIWVEHKERLLKQDFWLFDVKLIEKKDIKNPFQLNLENKVFGNPKNVFLDRIEKEKLIRKIFEETGSTQRDAKNLSNALKRIAGDLYTETERFIFELLQNADDIPNEKGEVDVKFNLLLENLLFLHNGKPFDNKDVESISSIGDSTKRKDAEKTGYKGIGFKSVFTDAETVLIRSGNFSFSFDKYSSLYTTLYENQNTEEIPWEIKPIWTEKYRYPKEVKNNNDFFEYPVAIDLEVGNEKIILYRKQFSQLFSEPRFILFLRHIKSIEIHGLDRNIKIQKKKKNERFELLSNENPIDEWFIDDFDFSVSQETRDAMANDKVVPEKLKEIQKSKLSFACQVNNNEIISIPSDKSFLFTYLPTNVNDYRFPFLVNADFLTTANRQDIHKKNSWNLFLFERIGYLCFKWISKFAKTSELRTSITNLIPNYYENSNELVHMHFNKGYDTAINEIAFLPAYKPLLTKVSDAIVDMTGFSDIIGEKLFQETQFVHKNLIINELQNKETLSKLAGITIFDKQKLKTIIANNRFGELTDIKELLGILHRNKELNIDSCDIRDIIENANLESINNWITSCEIETYEAFLKELEDSYLRKETKEKICQIKLFKFSHGEFRSINDVIKKVSLPQNTQLQTFLSYNYCCGNVFFKSTKIKKIAFELKKISVFLSEINSSEFPNIFSSIERMPEEKEMYIGIAAMLKIYAKSLSTQEKKKLFLNFINEETKFDNVDEINLKDLFLFCNSNSEIKQINKLIGDIKTPSWLNLYKIKQDEYFPELNPYLISESEDIFKIIYKQNQDDIIPKLTTVEEVKSLIKLYQDNQKQFFKELIIKRTKNYFSISKKTNTVFQVQSADKEVRDFINKFCSDNLFVLPFDFLDFKDEEGIVKNNDLYNNIIDCVKVDELNEELIRIISHHYISHQTKLKFLNNLTEIKFLTETQYNINSFEYNLLDLACEVLREQQDFLELREKIIIESDCKKYKLSEIPPISDKIKIETKEFSLSKILPSTYQNSNWISDLIAQFSEQGIPSERLNALFGINEEINTNDVYKKFTEQTPTLQNIEQFFFLIYFYKHISKVDLSILNFDITCAVFPSDFALDLEKLPEYMQEWIKQDQIKISNLKSIGIYTENSTLVSLRKFFLLKCDFNLNDIAKDENLSDGKMLFNTFELLKEKGIELKTENEFAVFKEMVRVINSSRAKGEELIIQDEFNFEILEEKSNIWISIGEFSIFLYKGALPKIVKLDKIEDYVFYRYNDNDYFVNNDKIFINENLDIKKTLQKVASDETNDFSFEELWKLFEEKQTNKYEDRQETNSTFLDDVNEFISDLEGTEWGNFVPELKNILVLSVSNPKEKQKLFNLIVKIKLTKENNVKFEDSDEGFNAVKIGNEKYFVHSARGAFAYIHPNEILKMKNEGYKMALDFSTKSRIKIYETAEEILQLNTNHILAYQYEKTMDELFTFCEANREANKHLLIIDKTNSGEKSRELLKLLNIEDDYQ